MKYIARHMASEAFMNHLFQLCCIYFVSYLHKYEFHNRQIIQYSQITYVQCSSYCYISFQKTDCSALLLSISNVVKLPDSALSILQRVQQETIFKRDLIQQVSLVTFKHKQNRISSTKDKSDWSLCFVF